MMILVAGPYRSGTGDDPADLMVRIARERGLAVFSRLEQVPGCG